MKLTDRLQKIVDLVQVTEGTIADVGTDHGFIPIALAYKFPNRKIYAMDVRVGPLSKAKENAKAYQVEQKIDFKLSDGLEACKDEPIQTIIIAGMGGLLIQEILEAGKSCLTQTSELILSPHKDYDVVRKKLHQLGFQIQREYYIKEQGKIYLLIYAKYGKDVQYSEWEYLYGKSDKTEEKELLRELRKQELKELKMVYNHFIGLDEVSREVQIKKDEIDLKIRELEELIKE